MLSAAEITRANQFLMTIDRMVSAMPNRIPKKRIQAVEDYRIAFLSMYERPATKQLAALCLYMIEIARELAAIYNENKPEGLAQVKEKSAELVRVAKEVGRYCVRAVSNNPPSR